MVGLMALLLAAGVALALERVSRERRQEQVPVRDEGQDDGRDQR